MKDRLSWMCALAFGLTVAAPQAAFAQAGAPADAKTFVNISGGLQLQQRRITSLNHFELFEEIATTTVDGTIDRGPIVDASVGRKVWNNIIVSLDFSWFRKGDVAAGYTAVIPSPVFFNQPTTTTGTVTDFEQSATAGSIVVTWLHPLTDKVDLAVFLGPSFMKVTQSIVTASGPTSGPATISTTTESKNTAKAGMLGMDLAYKLNAHYGAGLFVRYAGGEVDLPSAPNVKIGGIQAGVGLRARF